MSDFIKTLLHNKIYCCHPNLKCKEMITDETFLLYTDGFEKKIQNNILDINNNNNENNELPMIRRSSYYDFEKSYSVAQNNKHFSILSSNTQSINAKFSELEAFVNDLSSLNFKFSMSPKELVI